MLFSLSHLSTRYVPSYARLDFYRFLYRTPCRVTIHTSIFGWKSLTTMHPSVYTPVTLLSAASPIDFQVIDFSYVLLLDAASPHHTNPFIELLSSFLRLNETEVQQRRGRTGPFPQYPRPLYLTAQSTVFPEV